MVERRLVNIVAIAVLSRSECSVEIKRTRDYCRKEREQMKGWKKEQGSQECCTGR